MNDLKIVEWGSGIAAAYAAKMLAGAGANVVRAVDAARHDPHRDRDPAMRAYLDCDKTLVEIDTRDAGGIEALRRLCAGGDVLIEDHRPRDNAARGTDFERLTAINPRLVVASITPFGSTGPYRDFAANDAVVSFMCGLSYITPRDMLKQGDGSAQPPLKMPASVVSIYSGISAAAAIMSALRLREHTGRGHHVDIAMVETLVPTLRREIALYLYENVIANRFMRVWKLAPWGLKPCRDGYVFLQIVEPHHWLGLTDMMGNPEWAQDPRYLENDYRYDQRHDIEEKLLGWLGQHGKADIAFEAQRRSVPFAAVNLPRDLAHSPQLAFRKFFYPFASPQFSGRLFPQEPYRA